MTVVIAYADAGDGYLRCQDAHYADVRAGTGTVTVDTADTAVYWGQQLDGANFVAWQAFHSFTYSPDAASAITAAYVRLRCYSTWSTGVDRSLDVAEYDWDTTLTSADWRNGAWMLAASPLAAIGSAQNAGTKYMAAGSDSLAARLASASPLRVVVYSNRLAGGTVPTVNELAGYVSADESGTADDPALVWTTAPLSTHLGCGGAQARLSDGSWVYVLEAADRASATLRRHTSAGATTDLATLPIGTSSTDFRLVSGLQGLALAVDASDNIYVIGVQGSNTQALACRAYVKGAGTTWTAGTFRAASLPAYSAAGINNVAAAWHNVGTSGTLMVLAAHAAGWWNGTPDTDVAYALVNCQYLLTGTGSMLRASGNAAGTLWSPVTDAYRYTLFSNETGTGLDVAASPTDATRGYAFTFSGGSEPGTNAPRNIMVKYTLASDGASFVNAGGLDSNVWAAKNADTKLRVIAIGSSQWAVVSVDAETGWGPSFDIWSSYGTYGEWTNLAYVVLDSLGLTSLPAAATLAATAAWDAYYDSADNKLWFYYVDASNARTIRRTAIDLNTWLPTQEEIQVDTNVGTGAASVVKSIRVERNNVAGNSVLVTYGIETSGVLSSDSTIDSLNKAPTQPTLTPEANFDATGACTLEWTFNDPNAGDTQGAYQLSIYDTADNSLAYDSAKVTSATPSYVGAGAAASGNNATLTPAIHASSAAGDVLVVFASIRNSGTGTPNCPAGYVTLVSFANAALFGKVHSGSESAPSVSFANGAAGADTLAQVITLRNVPLNVVASATVLNGSAANVTYPALTVPVNNCAILICGWKQDDWTSVAQLAGMTEIGEAIATAGSDAAQVWDYVFQTTKANITSSAFTVTGGASAISRGITVALGPAGSSPTTASHSLPANTLDNAKSYRWRVRTYDAALAEGPWSNYSTFSCAAGGNVTITDPASDNPAGVVTDHYTVQWSVSGTTQASYRVVVTRTDDSTTLVDTGYVTSADTSYLVEGMLSDVEYQVAVTVKNAGAVASGTGTRLITPDFDSPDTPTLVVTAYDGTLQPSPYVGGYTEVAITNPGPTGDRPDVLGNEILRKRADGTGGSWAIASFSRDTEVAADGTFKDYTACSGVAYQYQINAVANTGAGSAESAWSTSTTLTLQGVWIHDPLDPAGTVKRYPYGKAARSSSVEVNRTVRQYAGRTCPVVDYGDPQLDEYQVSIYLPLATDEYGSDWSTDLDSLRTFAEARRTLCLRDNRGRSVHGSMSGYAERDEEAGTTVTFTFTRVEDPSAFLVS